MQTKTYLTAICLYLFSIVTLFSQTQYIGPDNGDWANPANWNNGLPANGNDPLIGGGGIVAITSPLAIDFTLTNFGSITASAAVTNNGTVSNSGSFDFTATGAFTNFGVFNNFGTSSMAGPASFLNETGASFTNTGNFTLQTVLVNRGGIVNNGTIDAANGTLQTEGTFNNNQSLTTESLTISNGSSFTNNFGSNLIVTGLAAQLIVDGSFTNFGSLIAEGVFTVNGTFSNSSGVSIVGTLTIAPAAQFNNAGGTVTNHGTVVNHGTYINGFQLINIGSFDNFGQFNNNNIITTQPGGTFQNRPTGSISMGYGSQIQNDGSFVNDGAFDSFGAIENNSSFVNNGTVNSFSGSKINNNPSGGFNNQGTINTNDKVVNNSVFANSGTININAGSQWTNISIFTNEITGVINCVQDFQNNAAATFVNNGQFRNTVRTLNQGSFTNNAFLNNIGDFTNDVGATLTNNELLLQEAGNILNKGVLQNNDHLLSDECSTISNDGTIDNSGNLEVHAILFQRGTVTGLAVNCVGCYVHTALTSDAPSICQNGTFGANINGDVKVYAPELIAFEQFDSCANMIYLANGLDRPVFNCSDIGTSIQANVVLRTRLNDSLTCTAIITPEDILEPQFTGCPNDQVIYTPGPTVAASWTEPVFVDNCTATNVVASHASGDSFPVGITGVTYTGTDGYGNANNCQFRVDVRQAPPGSDCNGDATAPTFSGCPTDIMLTTTGFNANAAWVAPVASDNCYPLTVSASHVPGQSFAVGTTTVTYTALDGNGNEGACSFDVTVNFEDPCQQDITPPSIVNCPANIYRPANSVTNGAVAIWAAPNVFDLCGVASLASSEVSGNVFPVGTTTVVYTAMDNSGNSSNCIFEITVGNDPCPGNVAPPVFTSCPADITILTTQNAEPADWAIPTATSSCGPVTLNSNYTPGSVFQLGSTKVTYTASDLKGNTSSCSFNIIVQNECSVDNQAPVISNCPADISVANIGGSGTASWAVPTAVDNCGLIVFTSSFLPGASFPAGVTTVIYTAVDLSGLVATCEFNVAVVDAPGCTANAAPVDLSTEVDPAAVDLSWNTALDADSYDIYLGTANPPTAIVAANVVGTSTTVADLQGNTVYFWYVVPKNAAGGAIACQGNVTQFSTANSVGGECNLNALFIAKSTNLNTSDATVKWRLEELGFNVTVRDDNQTATSDADGMGLIVISSTTLSTNVHTKFRDVAVPVIVYEGWLFDDFKMTGISSGYDYGSQGGVSYLKIDEPGHPLAAGLNGNTNIFYNYNTITWGKPTANATVVAHVPGNSNKATIFAYETGDQMVGMEAPARRVGFFLHNSTANLLTDKGVALFDAAVRWAAGLGQPGTACDDGDPTTGNDVIQADGCTCAGSTCNGQVDEFTFFDIDDEYSIPITDGETYYLHDLPHDFNIEAVTSGEVGSVYFTISGDANGSHTENYYPYRFIGDYNSLDLEEGEYTITATVYSEDHAGGVACGSLSVSFVLEHEDEDEPTEPKLLEVGEITFEQANANAWYFVHFENAFDEIPIVVLGPPSANSTQQVIPRIRSVNKTGFEFQLDEWDYLNGYHPVETLYYLAVLPGNHEIGGTEIEAGSFEANASWTTKYFDHPFDGVPVVLQTVASYNDGNAVAPRAKQVNGNRFKFKLQEEDLSPHAYETIHYVALEQGGFSYDGQHFFAGVTPNSVKHFWYEVDFGAEYSHPGFLASFHTFDGGDVCALRHKNLGGEDVQIRVEEEQYFDNEMNHTTEAVGWLVFGSIKTDDLAANSVANFEFETVKGEEHAEFYWTHNEGFRIGAYILEKSTDGAGFQPIAELQSKGGKSAEMYQGFDLSPLVGNNFYRVKLVGLDGSISYSEVKTIHFADLVDFVLFPNPANDFVKINLEEVVGAENVTIQIFNNLGVLMQSFELDEVYSKYYQLDIRTLQEGHYIVWLNVPGRRPMARQLVVGKI